MTISAQYNSWQSLFGVLECWLGLSSEVLEQVFGKPLASVTEQAVLSTANI